MKHDRSWTWRRVGVTDLKLDGMTAAIFGGTGGIGRAVAHLLAARGASVTVIGQTFRDKGRPGIAFMPADLSLMREARRVGRDLAAGTLDLVLMTTGTMAGPLRETTAEGIERDLAISYLSRLVILDEMAPRLGQDRPDGSSRAPMKPRIFIMGFPGTGQAGKVDDLNTERTYSRWGTHMNTVAGNELLVLDTARRFPRVEVFGLNPGFVKTNIRANLFGANRTLLRLIEGATGFLTTTPEAYADTVTPLLVSPDLAGHSGAMFDKKANPIHPTAKLTDVAYRAEFLTASRAMVDRAVGASPEA